MVLGMACSIFAAIGVIVALAANLCEIIDFVEDRVDRFRRRRRKKMMD